MDQTHLCSLATIEAIASGVRRLMPNPGRRLQLPDRLCTPDLGRACCLPPRDLAAPSSHVRERTSLLVVTGSYEHSVRVAALLSDIDIVIDAEWKTDAAGPLLTPLRDRLSEMYGADADVVGTSRSVRIDFRQCGTVDVDVTAVLKPLLLGGRRAQRHGRCNRRTGRPLAERLARAAGWSRHDARHVRGVLRALIHNWVRPVRVRHGDLDAAAGCRARTYPRTALRGSRTGHAPPRVTVVLVAQVMAGVLVPPSMVLA